MEPVSTALLIGGARQLWKLWEDGECFDSQLLGGVVGNLLASLGYDHLVKPGVERLGGRVRELLRSGGRDQNHDLLRAIRYAECDALVALCEETLSADFGVEAEILKTNVEDVGRILKRFKQPEIRSLLALRKEFRKAASGLASAPLAELQQQAVGLVREAPALLRFGDAEAAAAPESTSEGRLRSAVTERWIAALETSLQGGIPTRLRERLQVRWFDAYRVAFRERLKTEPRARAAFELDVLSHLEGVPARLDEMLERLDGLDLALQDLLVQRNEDSVKLSRLLAGQEELREELLGLPIVPFRETRKPDRRPGDPRDSDLFLIQPRYRQTELLGRDSDLDSLWAWLHGPSEVSTRLLIGHAGSGKTRLAYELLLRLADAKGASWQGGFVTHEVLRDFDSTRWARWRWRLPTLLVVDYAQRSHRPLEEMLKAVAREGDVRRPPLRILLLEREAEERAGWFAELRGAQPAVTGRRVGELFDPEKPVPVTQLESPELRRRLLQQALASVAAFWGKPVLPLPEPGTSVAFDERLSAPHFADPLTLLMASLVAHERRDVATALALDRTDLAFAVAEREAQRLRHFLPDKAEGWQRSFVLHGAAAVCFCEGLPEDALLTLVDEDLTQAKVLWPGGPGGLVQILMSAMPARRPDADGLCTATLEPDTVAEAFVLRYFGKPIARRLRAASALRCSRARPGPFVRRLFHAWQNFNSDPASLEQLLEWFEALASAADLAELDSHSFELLSYLESSLPTQTTELSRRATDITRRLYDRAAAAPADGDGTSSERARLANNLANRMGELGRREEALPLAEEAVRLYRELCARNPEAFRPALASALSNLGVRLSEVGQREEALPPSEEAVRLRRELAAQDLDAFRPDLASALNNLASRLRDLGRREDTLPPAEEAVQLRRELAARNPDDFLPDLGMALNNLANNLSELGRHKEALPLAEEAVRLYREFAARNPDAFRPDLAMALSNLANRLGELGRPEEALKPAEEAVRLRRELAARNPDAFRPALASALRNLAILLSKVGMREEALPPAEEAVQVYRDLAAHNPDAFRHDLAMALNNLANRLGELGRREKALSPAEEAVRLYHELAARNPGAFSPGLAIALNNLANRLGQLGQHREALPFAEEAVKLNRELAVRNPDAFSPSLAMALYGLANRFSELGQHKEALPFAEEAVRLSRELAARNPDAFSPRLAMALNGLASCLGELGRREEELPPAAEALRLYRELAARNPDAFRPALASALNNLANHLSELGRHVESLTPAEEAAQLFRELTARNPEAFSPDLAMALSNLASRMGELGRSKEALPPAVEAVRLNRDLAARNPDAFRPALASSLTNLASHLSELGRREEALVLAEEATELYRELAVGNPDAFRTNLAISCGALGSVLLAESRASSAVSTFEEGIRVLEPTFAKLPQAFGSLMLYLIRHYLQATEAASAEPDAKLLTPIWERLRPELPS